MTINDYILFLSLALVAEIIGTVSGFGSSILFIPLASLFFEFQAVLGITALFHVFSNLSKIALFRKGINTSIVLWLGIPAVVFVILGALLSNRVPQKELEVLMSCVLVVLAGQLLYYQNKTLDQSHTNLIVGGVSSGFLAGLVGTGGALRGLTLAAFNLEKEAFITTSAIIDLGVDTSRAIIYLWNGYVKQEYVILILCLILISVLGSWLGKLIVGTLSDKVFKYLILSVILLTCCFQIITYFYSF